MKTIHFIFNRKATNNSARQMYTATGAYLLYWQGDTVFVGSERKVEAKSLNALLESPPRGKGYLLVSEENIKSKVVSIPQTKGINVARVMQHEALELVQEDDLESLRQNYIFNWRLLWEEKRGQTTEREFILFVAPRSSIESFLSAIKTKGLKVEDVFVNIDLLIRIGENYAIHKEDFVIYFYQNKIYFFAYKDKKYVFHRELKLTTLSAGSDASKSELQESVGLEELYMEIKRSIFYAKQKFKLEGRHLTLFSDSQAVYRFLKERKEDLNFNLIETPLEREGEKDRCLILSLWLKYHSFNLASLLPPEFSLEKCLKRMSYIGIGIALITFGLSLGTILKYTSDYNKKLAQLNTILYQENIVKKRLLKYPRDQILKAKQMILKPRLPEVQRMSVPSSNINNCLVSALDALPYLVPSEILLRTLDLKTSPTSDILSIEGKILVNGPQRRSEVLQRFISNLKHCILIDQIKEVERDSLFDRGTFRLRLTLACVKQMRSR